MDRDFELFQEEIKRLKEKDILIIVEGKKDKVSLEKLGFDKVMQLEKRAIYKVVEDVAINHKICAILTDLDKEGKKLYAKLNSGLCERGVFVDNRFRLFLFKNTKLRQIEGLYSYYVRNSQVF